MFSEKKLKPTQITELNLERRVIHRKKNYLKIFRGLEVAFEQLVEKGREKVQKAIFLYSSAYTLVIKHQYKSLRSYTILGKPVMTMRYKWQIISKNLVFTL